VERFLKDEPITARPPSNVYKIHKFVQRNQRLAISFTAVLVVLEIGVIGTSTSAVVAYRASRRANINEQVAKEEVEKTKRANENALQMLIQDAIAFALSKNDKLTREYIDRMKLVGASDAKVEMIRAFLLSGDNEMAKFRDLQQRVIQLDPTNIPIRALAARQAMARGYIEEFLERAGEALAFSPTEPEDYVLLALLFHRALPKEAITLLDDGSMGHDSGLARYVRATSLSVLALEVQVQLVIGRIEGHSGIVSLRHSHVALHCAADIRVSIQVICKLEVVVPEHLIRQAVNQSLPRFLVLAGLLRPRLDADALASGLDSQLSPALRSPGEFRIVDLLHDSVEEMLVNTGDAGLGECRVLWSWFVGPKQSSRHSIQGEQLLATLQLIKHVHAKFTIVVAEKVHHHCQRLLEELSLVGQNDWRSTHFVRSPKS
jgi:hypothetical protein